MDKRLNTITTSDVSPGSKTLLSGSGRLKGGETNAVDRDMQDAGRNRPAHESGIATFQS